MGFREIAGSPLMFTLVIVGLLYIMFYAAIFLKKSYNRCLELGINKQVVKNVIKSSLIFSIAPSLAIVIGFFSLAAAFGIAWPWWRLSVIGSVGYELMASETASGTLGYGSIGEMVAANNPEMLSAIMIVMSIGILGGFFVIIPFAKKISLGLISARKQSSWGVVMSSCFMLTLLAVFMPSMLLTDPVSTATLITSAVLTIFVGFLIKKFHWTWLANFVLAIALIGGMIASVGWSALLG